MSLSKTNTKGSGSSTDDSTSGAKTSNPVVRIDRDSDDNLQALFDSVLNPGDSKRPLQVPFRMRKLPNSFFNPPAASAKSPSVSHSRANSADSAYDAGSQPNVNQAANPTAPPPSVAAAAAAAATSIAQGQAAQSRPIISHSRAHSSPASLQQTYSIHSGNISGGDGAAGICPPEGLPPGFVPSLAGMTTGSAASGAIGLNRASQCIIQGQTSSIPAFHMKQRSYDVVSPIQLQNELGALPPGWEQAKTNDGQIYYLNHITKTTQWEDPRIQLKQQALQQSLQQTVGISANNKESATITDPLGPLPEGWEQAFTENNDVYFINHVDRTTSWNDPRIPDYLQKTVKVPKGDMSWVNVRQLEKEQEFFKQKQPEPSALNRPGNASLQMDPFLSGDNHARQESGDSGLSLSSATFSVNNEFIPQIDESMDCMSENGNLNGLDCPDNLVSSLQLEDNICNEMFNDVNSILNTSSTKPDNLEWYKIN